MTRILRGAWSRRGALATLVAMTAVVVAGTVTVLGFAAAADTSRLLTAPLLLLGAVAVPSIGRELALARREEIGLARLRGIRGARLGGFLLVEPLLGVVLGTLLGLALGAGATVLATRAWLGEAASPLGGPAVLAAVATAVGGLAIVLAGSFAALREPLAAQVATTRRPRPGTTLMAFLSVLVLVGAAVAAYRSREATTTDPDALVLIGPALVGLALGQATIWLLRLLARGATSSTRSRGLASFLAARRLARADDLVTPLRLLVAAAVVGVMALTGASAVSDWTDTEARIAAVGPVTVPAGESAVGALALTRELDPEGRYLMATATVPNENRLAERRGYLDASRFEAVAGDFYDGTPTQAAAAAVPGLATGAPDLAVVADRLTVTARTLQHPGPGSRGIAVRVDYVTGQNFAGSAEVELPLGRPGSTVTRSVRVPDCGGGCQLAGLAVTRLVVPSGTFIDFDLSPLRALLTRVDLGGADLLEEAWQPDLASIRASRNNRFIPGIEDTTRVSVNRGDGLEVAALPVGELRLLMVSASTPLPVLTAGSGLSAPLDLSGDDRKAAPVGAFAALPLVGSMGHLSDLPSSSIGSGPTVPSADVEIVVASDAPDELVADLTAATGTTARSLGDVRRDIGDAAGADQARGYLLMAAACGLVALLALAAGVARHRRGYRHDVASLRVLGIGLATARRAGRAELAALAVLVVVAIVAGGWLAVVLLLDGLPLIAPSAAAQPLDTGPSWLLLAVPGILAAAAVLLVGGRARAVRTTTTQPSMLRDGESR